MLEVAVDDAVGVTVFDAFADLFEKLESFPLGESIDTLGTEVGEEVSTLDKFGNEVCLRADMEHFDQSGDRGTALA